MIKEKYPQARKGKSFGKTLTGLMDGRYSSAMKLAEAIYDDRLCFDIIRPRGMARKAFTEADRKKDLKSIARSIQRHMAPDMEAYHVQSDYMLAYSIIFDCSLDFLFGKIEEPCPDLEIKDISEKTGLSYKAVENLMQKKELDVEEYLSVVNHYDILNPGPGREQYFDDDGFLNSSCSFSTFWSDLIESRMFDEIPRNWYRTACALYTKKWMKILSEETKEFEDELPSYDTFASWIETYNFFHEDNPVCIPFDKPLKEIYDTEPEWVKSTYREIRYEHYYSAAEKAEETETAYWGCAGMFDRLILTYLHDLAEAWCYQGPLPKVPDPEQ